MMGGTLALGLAVRDNRTAMSDARESFTERLLHDAGVGEGMRVLDLGCGHGDVSLMVATRVGPTGEVVGVDRNAQALARAEARRDAEGLGHVRFVQGDLGSDAPDGDFDAIVGRRVLMYLRDPEDVLRRLAGSLRPGGLMIFQEQDSTMVPASVVPLPLHRQVHEWIWTTVEREGADVHMGFHLAGVLEGAGLQVEHLRAEAIVQAPGIHHDVARIVRVMLRRITAHGVASEEEIQIDSLAERLAAEREAAQATYVGDMVFGAWGRKRSG